MRGDAPSPAPDATGLPARVVLDTNVLISAALLPRSVPARLLQHVLVHSRLVFSLATFTELETRLWKPKFDRYLSMDMRLDLLRNLNGAALWVDIAPELATQGYSRDPQDDMFIHAALAAGAGWLITGDQDLLTVAPIDSLRVCTPADAMAQAAFLNVLSGPD